MMTQGLILFVQGPLAVWFMTFVDPNEVHVLSNLIARERYILQNHLKAVHSSCKAKWFTNRV